MTEKNRSPPLSDGTSTEAIEPTILFQKGQVVENGLEVSEAHTCEESLEDYFKRVTGGEGIA